jgi:hypothetical protein
MAPAGLNVSKRGYHPLGREKRQARGLPAFVLGRIGSKLILSYGL